MIGRLNRSHLSLIHSKLSSLREGKMTNGFGYSSLLGNSLPNLSLLLFLIILLPKYPHKKIWNPAVPPRVQAFSWTAVLCQINTMDMLPKRRPFIVLSPQWCSLCHNNGESVNHIFLHCSFTFKVWTHLTSRIGYYWVMPEKLIQLFSSWRSISDTIRSTKFGDSLMHAILWGI